MTFFIFYELWTTQARKIVVGFWVQGFGGKVAKYLNLIQVAVEISKTWTKQGCCAAASIIHIISYINNELWPYLIIYVASFIGCTSVHPFPSCNEYLTFTTCRDRESGDDPQYIQRRHRKKVLKKLIILAWKTESNPLSTNPTKWSILTILWDWRLKI